MKPLDVYEKLRCAHREIKDLIYDDTWDETNQELKDAIDAVSLVLYMAEYIAVKEDGE